MSTRTTIAVFLTFFLGGLAWGFLPAQGLWPKSQLPVTQQDPAETKEQIHTELGTFARLAQELKPSVVNISVVRDIAPESLQDLSEGFRDASGQGSGVIISSDGDVLTNYHWQTMLFSCMNSSKTRMLLLFMKKLDPDIRIS